ncbi:Uncharacterised protein [Citrobacter koseri]|nr:Uncharacterised protein [Citrobacter koseri]
MEFQTMKKRHKTMRQCEFISRVMNFSRLSVSRLHVIFRRIAIQKSKLQIINYHVRQLTPGE